jgi:hypothetical protein
MDKFICNCHNREWETQKDFKQHFWDETHKEMRKLNMQKNDLLHTKERKTYHSNRYQENRNKALLESRNNYLIHKDKHLAKTKEYRQTPKGKAIMKAILANRKAIPNCSKLVLGIVQEIYQENIIKYGVLTCELCFKPIIFGEDSLEHKIPLCRYKDFPGIDLNAKDNLGVAHLSCNQKKYARTLKEWFQLHPEYCI